MVLKSKKILTMSIKRIIATSATLLLGLMSINAAATHLTVELKAGNKYSFLLADKPVITFSNGDLVVNGDAETSYSIDGVKNFHFTEGDASGVESLSVGDIRIVSLDNATIQVQNLEKSSVVTLVNVSGVVLSSVKADAEGYATVSLPQAKGVYVLSVGAKSFKIIRK